MRVVVIGGTGRTGRLVAERAAARGCEVVVFGRTASGSGAVAGDATDPRAVLRAVEGAHAVVVALSIPRASASPWARVVGPPDLHSRSAAAVIDAMSRSGARRLVKVSAQGVGASAGRTGIGFRALVAASNLRPAFADHAVADDLVRASGLDFTVVHPPRLSEGPPVPLVAGEAVSTGTFATVPRAALAQLLVDMLDAPEWFGRTVSVST